MNNKQQALYEALKAARKDADENFSAKPVGSATQPCLMSLAVHFLPDESDLQEVWDLWIEERPSTSAARTVLDLKTLPHRFLANPGRISWKDNSYIFISDRRGMSEITLDVMGPEGEYGQGSLKLQIMGK